MTNHEAYERGFYDGKTGRRAVFRSTRAHGIIPVIDDPQADDWSPSHRASYLKGYDAGEEMGS